MGKISDELAAEFNRIAEETKRAKDDLIKAIAETLTDAKWHGEEDYMGNYRSYPKASSVEVIDGAVMVEWTPDGEVSQRFAIEVTVL